jgi:hypothetical protein
LPDTGASCRGSCGGAGTDRLTAPESPKNHRKFPNSGHKNTHHKIFGVHKNPPTHPPRTPPQMRIIISTRNKKQETRDKRQETRDKI